MLLPGAVFALLAVRNIRGVSEFAVLVPALVAAAPARVVVLGAGTVGVVAQNLREQLQSIGEVWT